MQLSPSSFRVSTPQQATLDDLAAKYKSMGSNLEKLMDDKIEEVQSQIVSAQESKIASLAVKIRKVAVRGGGSTPGAACVGVLGVSAWGWAS